VENGIALHLYYIVLEAVANAVKHGRAKNVLITLEPSSDRFLLNIRDDGIGFSPPTAAQTGMGIRIMQYRARVIGATLSLQSRPESGTEVSCLFLPIQGNGAKRARDKTAMKTLPLQKGSEGEAMAKAHPEKSRILIVEDHPLFVKDCAR